MCVRSFLCRVNTHATKNGDALGFFAEILYVASKLGESFDSHKRLFDAIHLMGSLDCLQDKHFQNKNCISAAFFLSTLVTEADETIVALRLNSSRAELPFNCTLCVRCRLFV